MTKHVTLGSQVVVISCVSFLLTYSLNKNSISDAGAQALTVGLQHCTNLQTLR